MPAGAAWCTLCYARVPAAPAERAGSVEPAAPLGPGVPLEPAGSSPGRARIRTPAGWPCSGCGATVPMELPGCPACGAGFLADLHEPGTIGVTKIDQLAGLAARNRMAAWGVALAACGSFLLLWVVFGLLA